MFSALGFLIYKNVPSSHYGFADLSALIFCMCVVCLANPKPMKENSFQDKAIFLQGFLLLARNLHSLLSDMDRKYRQVSNIRRTES